MREAKLLDRDDRLRVELALGQPLFLDGLLDLLLRGHADLPEKLAHRLVESLIHRNAPSDYLFGVVRRWMTDVKTAPLLRSGPATNSKQNHWLANSPVAAGKVSFRAPVSRSDAKDWLISIKIPSPMPKSSIQRPLSIACPVVLTPKKRAA